MIALRVFRGEAEEPLDAYESQLLDRTDPVELDLERRKEERMLEKEREWKRVVRMLM